MTPQQLLGAGVRLFAIWLALTSIGYFGSIPAALAASPVDSGSSMTVAYAIGAAYLTGALLLWFFPMFTAHKLLPRTSHSNHINVHGHELARVGCALMGLWLSAKALPTVMWLLFRAFLFVEAGSTFSALPPESKLDVAVALFELLLGTVLIVKSGLFAKAVVPRLEMPPRTSVDL